MHHSTRRTRNNLTVPAEVLKGKGIFGGIAAGIRKAFDHEESDNLRMKIGQKNFAGFGEKLVNPVRDFAIPAGLLTRQQMQDNPQENARLLNRAPVKTLSNPMPSEVSIKGPVQVGTKGKLGTDPRIAADQGLKVAHSGVDKSGAPNIVGDGMCRR
ncbi:hypothetical protein LJ656_33570 [Paraburkholderia sp. MMS20-SJTR3]|uniref:Uncharacterized protein n=1 Tax=Paraburkholderia sejongensis TaxID=2886946 RepID=A0ABS8K5R4_9BURK|nr:hypothetical protein [Paraburkholderia sp. MMS20-SJTR3]MCC8397486.1 hypothetical protein [Paraburkholderia sp. MMS20-SJTR3]